LFANLEAARSLALDGDLAVLRAQYDLSNVAAYSSYWEAQPHPTLPEIQIAGARSSSRS
jgi:hypothetical protein